MIIEGNGHDEWNGQPAMGTVGMKEGKMGMEVENGVGWRWPCAWGFMHASMKWMWWLKKEKVVTGSWGLLHRWVFWMDFHPRMQPASQNSIIEVLRCIGLCPWNLQSWRFQARNPQFSPSSFVIRMIWESSPLAEMNKKASEFLISSVSLPPHANEQLPLLQSV
ncbi:hypothetical protein VitviT2T_019711 [Vitis vinifera]|uniref:Uncharacterized protein n=1 Tax=Vitis vinifera TaxID=29760 RepID=A0ABY9D1C6_VITVI|nr:hypothetical protein VitviT2T_019711 [Vitis vinifera]